MKELIHKITNLRHNKKLVTTILIILALVLAWNITKDKDDPILERNFFSATSTSEIASRKTASAPFSGEAGTDLLTNESIGYIPAESVAVTEAENTPAQDRKVIKTGSLFLLVTHTETAAGQIQEIAQGMGGLVQNLNIYGSGRTKKTGTVTIKVPVEKFNETIASIKQIADEVESETHNTNDVTEQYVDMQARLKNMRAEEEQYQNILKQAKSIEDILNVTQRLSSIRGQIERTEVQLKHLSEQVEMSTITVTLSAEGDVEVLGIHWRPSIIVRQSYRNMLISLTEYVDGIIKFLFRLPLLIIWFITLGVGLFVVLWIGKKIFRKWIDNNPLSP